MKATAYKTLHKPARKSSNRGDVQLKARPGAGNHRGAGVLDEKVAILAAPKSRLRTPSAGLLQAKLRIGPAQDEYEREADRIADHVMRMPEPSAAAHSFGGAISDSWNPIHADTVQRKCACGGAGGECEECRKKRLQRKAANSELQTQNEALVPPIVHEVLRSPGRPLDRDTRDLMEQHFCHDFSQVRIHDDASASESARTMAALAYTVGKDIVFGSGAYAPNSFSGRRLLAHELAHTIQQHSVQRSPIGGAIIPQLSENPRLEREADQATAVIGSHDGLPTLSRVQLPTLQRQPDVNSAYNITLTYPPNHTESYQRLPFGDALVVLSRFSNRIEARIEGGYEGHRYLQEVHEDQFIVSGIADLFAWTRMPSLMIWNVPRMLLVRARALIATGDVTGATRELQQAAEATRASERRVYEYREGTIAGAERAVLGLEVVQVASAAVVTVGTGGTAGVLLGAGYAGVQRLAGEGMSVHLGLQEEIDWAGIAFDTLFAAVLGKFGGVLGGKIAARLGGQITARVASTLIVGRASGLVHAAMRELFDAARGRTELTWEGFIDRLASQLTARAVFLDLVAHAAGSATPARRTQATSEPLPVPTRPRTQLSSHQGDRPGSVPMRNGRVSPSLRSPTGRTTRGESTTQARGNLALAQEPHPVTEPVVRPVPRLLPAPIQEPIQATTTPPNPSSVASGAAIAAAAGPAASSPATSNPAVQVRLELPIEKIPHAYLYSRLLHERALEHTPNVPRFTAQERNWDTALRPGGTMEMNSRAWLAFEARDIPEIRRLRPNWSRALPFVPMQVDHRVEWQLLGTTNRTWGDTMANYELLDQTSNRNSGNTLRNNIRRERQRLARVTGNPAWLIQRIIFTQLVVPGSAPAAHRWLPEEIQQGHHYSALLDHERGRY